MPPSASRFVSCQNRTHGRRTTAMPSGLVSSAHLVDQAQRGDGRLPAGCTDDGSTASRCCRSTRLGNRLQHVDLQPASPTTPLPCIRRGFLAPCIRPTQRESLQGAFSADFSCLRLGVALHLALGRPEQAPVIHIFFVCIAKWPMQTCKGRCKRVACLHANVLGRCKAGSLKCNVHSCIFALGRILAT